MKSDQKRRRRKCRPERRKKERKKKKRHMEGEKEACDRRELERDRANKN